jgi:hypothetical protein
MKGVDVMDPITLIVAALAAGASAGLGDAASQAIKDAYAGLKGLIKRRFAGNAKAEETLADHEADPETYEKPLEKQLMESGVAEDRSVIEAAQKLMALVDPQGSAAGQYNVGSISADRGGIAAAHIEGGATADYHPSSREEQQNPSTPTGR